MADLGVFFVCTLEPFLAPVLIDAHTLNNAGLIAVKAHNGKLRYF